MPRLGADALPHWPKLRVSAAEAAGVRNGHPVPFDPEAEIPCADGTRVLLLEEDGKPLALAQNILSPQGPAWTILRGLWHTEP